MVLVASSFSVGDTKSPIYIGRGNTIFRWVDRRWKAVRGTWFKLTEEKKNYYLF
jgi:hypothetical protein